jgi:hypothetical protein
MSLQFPDRSKWLALRSLQPSPPRFVWDRGTYSPGNNKGKRSTRAEAVAKRAADVARYAAMGCKAPKHRFA